MKLFVSFIILGLAGAYPTVSETACDVCKTSIVQIQELFSDENVVSIFLIKSINSLIDRFIFNLMVTNYLEFVKFYQ